MPKWSELARGGIVSQEITCGGEETKARSMSVQLWSETRVGSETTWVKLKENITDDNLEKKVNFGYKNSQC